MNAHTLHEKCKSRELITAFNKKCLCISYKLIKSQWSNLAKFTFLHSLLVEVPLPGHFDTQSCTIVALDNPNNAEIISISGGKPEHDAVLTVFQINLQPWNLNQQWASLTYQLLKICYEAIHKPSNN